MRSCRLLVGTLGVLAVAGCAVTGPATGDAGPVTAHVTENFVSAGPGAAITYDKASVPEGARGAVEAVSADGRTTVRLAVRGLKAGSRYGAQMHDAPCGTAPQDTGAAYQFVPASSNPGNEIRMDFQTDDDGAASAEATVEQEFPEDRRPHSVVVQALDGADAAGGAPDACITVTF